MRLTPTQRLAIKQRFADELGPGCEVRVFGSRADDAARGGDLDLLVVSPGKLAGKVWLASRLAAFAERLLDGRKVDVLLVDPDTTLQPVHRAAMQGVAL
ncbi:MAG: nucleotidyltransferase domain-containing protein [Ramlibacter sp.]